MVLGGVVRLLVIFGLIMGSLVIVAPGAAAHDNDCLLAVHAGPVKQHVECDDRKKDRSHCLASVKVMFVHQRVGCE